MGGNNTIKLTLQREGRLSQGSTDLLHAVGLEFDSYLQRLFASCRNFDLELLFVRDDDIPEYVADGVADLGIVGRNLVLEHRLDVEELIPLGFGFCSLVVAVPNEAAITCLEDLRGAKVATSYPASTRSFFEERGVPVQVIPISGSVELTPALGVAQAIAELTATGSTLRLNDLREIETIYRSEAVLIANRQSLAHAGKAKNIERLGVRINAAIAARNYKYVMMNAPRSALPEIRRIVPGLRTPTIVDLADPDWVAIHTAISSERFWDIIEQLREVGASEILVSPIESMIM